ncbi:uncharacterized protein LOC124299218 [Neodiprion virginianus]|uniref:uncharacterized protein LOC124299218 n=1 Tax=Neodiprion virginianus TaxID=2961670 RepID=UPI001EE779C6|nr:uncharacterized protein LOC124299218 [Neodiprion virginianus]
MTLEGTKNPMPEPNKSHLLASKASENLRANESCVGGVGGGGGGGGLGKWLREHLGGSRGSHEVSSGSVKRNVQSSVGSVGSVGREGVAVLGGVEKSAPRLTYASQNLYCSLPREHGRSFHNGAAVRKVSPVEIQGHNRPRSNGDNYWGKNTPPTPVPPVLKRGGPVYSSDGKSMRRRNRDRRRHSLNEAQEERIILAGQGNRCIPDGGDVGRTMTDLQPSPPGYRGQDEPPGPARSPASAPFQPPYKNATSSYPAEIYNGKQPSSPRGGQADFYHIQKNDGSRNEVGKKKTSHVAMYNDGYKKNTPGYKNDSGYSESSGFGSYSLPLSERDEASPPPTPPVRDASSLKGVCYGPGHEKYPSWPSAPEHHTHDEDLHAASSLHGGSHRSKSWTDHTSYPKEKPAQYTRPHAKRPNPAFTQQLKTVMERCEKIPAETYESRNRSNTEATESRLWPRVDREGKSIGDVEYVAPSPPEREQQPPQTLSHADLEAYVRSYQDPQVSQVDLYQESALTQAGLEEYARVQHSQQASYAQSEGYHSYVSSVDSTTNTPFLDRLRRDSEAVAQRAASSWEDAREGRDSVVTTSSGSASSSETLKWHGSMSDVSVASGLPARQVGLPEKWLHHGSMSDVSIISPQKQQSSNLRDQHKWQGSLSDVSSAKNARKQEKWQNSMNDRNKRAGRAVPENVEDVATEWQETGTDGKIWPENNVAEKYVHHSQPTPQSSDEWIPHHGSMSDLSTAGLQSSKQLIAHSARVQTPQRHHSESVLYLDRERSQRKLQYAGGTHSQASQDSGQSSSMRMAPTSPQQPQLSVAERISELEKQQQQQMRYTYLDPDKRHRVSDPTLKAIQKKALLSFYERHHQASWRSEPQLAQGVATPAPQSPPPQPPPRPRPASSRRASSASDYASGGAWREKSGRGSNVPEISSPCSPKHQHSNSCGSLSTDLLGPVIVGQAISIDDWVPERPPKKPHLRNAYNDRVPSPDLPPPSPPTVTEHEVLNCDDPLPPPPSDLQNDAVCGQIDNKENSHTDRHAVGNDSLQRTQQPERQSTRRSSKHGHKRDQDRVKSPNKTSGEKNSNLHFVRSSTSLKQGESGPAVENGVSAGFATHRMVPTGRSSLRYPATQKLMVNGRVAPLPARRTSEERVVFPARPPAQLPDLISQRYSDSGNQRPAPQVPVEPRILRQESMRAESCARIDASGLLRNDSQRLESSSGQRPQPQVPKTESKGPAQPPRPNYLPLLQEASKYPENGLNFTLGSPVKTSYEASSKLFAEGSPQKYHEPPKYVPNSQRTMQENGQRNYYALPPKYADLATSQKPQPQTPVDRYSAGSSPGSPPPPPLAPRLSTSGRKSLPPPPRPAPPHGQQGSQSKASYLAYRRERGAPDSEGSYKRTMSPTARLDDWPPLRDHDDPVLVRVTPRHPHHHHHHPDQQLPKSHSVDALHHRMEERAAHSVEVIGKLSYDLSKKLQATEVRQPRGEGVNNNVNNANNAVIHNNNNNNNNNSINNHLESSNQQTGITDPADRKERISPQSIEVLNDRNRQLERERRKLAASCEPSPQRRSQDREILSSSESFQQQQQQHHHHHQQRERSATIEMTSRNVELLNRRNALGEKRLVAEASRPPPVIEKPPPPTSSPPRTPEVERRRSGTDSPRRSGSCSSSSSSSSSPRVSDLGNNTEKTSPPNSPNVSGESASFVERISVVSSRRKVSSPTQTDDDRRDEYSGSNQAKYSQTSGGNESADLGNERTALTSLCVSPQPGIEGLTLVQRTEIVLRVNAATSDAASQTEIIPDDGREARIDEASDDSQDDVIPEPRRKLQEEIECEELSRDLASQLSPNDRLVTILVPVPEHKKPTDYVTGLFRVEATLQPRPRRRLSLSIQDETPSSPTATTNRPEDIKIETPSSTISTPELSTPDPTSPLSPTSAYFTTSEGKARFLTRYSRDVTEESITTSVGNEGNNDSAQPIVPDNQDLKQKKEELVLRLDRKLVVLRAEQEAVREEGDVNDALGARVTSRVTAVARPAEASKYRLHVEEVGKITSLLLGLSGRLARAENALYGMPVDHAERKILESKRDKLLDQLEEAKVLKGNIDKRSVSVSAILSKYLNEEEYADYQHFINMKAKLIMDGREIQDKVKLGEEQLTALKEAID